MYNPTSIRKFILASFSEEELLIFCRDHFTEVNIQFSQGMSLQFKVDTLVAYCDRRGVVASLVEKLKAERPLKYQEDPKLLDATGDSETVSPLEQIRAGEHEIGEMLKPYEPLSMDRPAESVAESVRISSHPLTQDLPTVKNWFLNQLKPNEQVFIVAAMFSGLERKDLLDIYQDLLDILVDTSSQQEEPSVITEESSTAVRRKLHFTFWLDDEPVTGVIAKSEKKLAKPVFIDETQLLDIANLTTMEGKRNTEHGLTTVRLIEFQDETHRQKILRLLGESFSEVLLKITPYIFLLGAHPNTTVRQRVADTVGELMCTQDFIHYKDGVIKRWAMTDNLYMNACVGTALARAVRDERFRDNVKALLKHWITSDNPSLNWTATASCAQLGSTWPEFSLDLLEKAILKGRTDLLVLVFIVMRGLCHAGYGNQVLKKIANWAKEDRNYLTLRQAAVLIFLDVIQLKHLSAKEQSIERVIDLVLTGSSEINLPEIKQIREATMEKVKAWAKETASQPSRRKVVEKLYQQLYIRPKPTRDQKRIVWHYQRWAREDKEILAVIESAAPQSLIVDVSTF